MAPDRTSVLFVCLGNICRSPLAESVFREQVERAGLAERFVVDSAGTSSWHEGEGPDRRAVEEARQRGVDVRGRARKITARDLEQFDYVVAMDAENLAEVKRLAARGSGGAELRLLREFDPEANGELDVPDPYFGGPDGFERVHDIVERASAGLLAHIRAERRL